MRWRKLLLAAAASTAALLGTSASASTLDIDMNGFKVSGGTGMSTTFTGTLTFTSDGNTTIAEVRKNDIDQSFTGTLASYSGSISFIGGEVSGGDFSIKLTNGDEYEGKFYHFVGAGTSAITKKPGTLNNWRIDAGTHKASFHTGIDSLFGNVDVSEFIAQNGSLFGELFQFEFEPDGSGIDENVFAEYTVVVPVPPAAGLGLAGLLGVAALRRRRNKVA